MSTTESKPRVPAVEGWFTTGDAPALLAGRCDACGTYVFPNTATWCPNPVCDSTAFTEVEMSRRGTVWSWTNACYQPPAPYVAKDPYEPFTIAAVQLAEEHMVVLGQVVEGVGVEDLALGAEVELVVDTLYEDDDREVVVWKWRPTGGSGASGSEARA